jgi:uncharacterized short protein YbdD (DUF466 family)
MICRCFGRNLDFSTLAKRVGETANLMVGVPDYDAYTAHMRQQHAGEAPMSRQEFFRERQSARYGAVGKAAFRCC